MSSALAATAIGIDIGGTNLRAARVAADGTILARGRAASDRDPGVVLDRLIALIEDLDDPSVAAIGIGVPGRVDFTRRAILSGGYVDLSGIAVASRLEARFSRPVVVDNDASMALVAEARIGAGRGARHLALLTIGTGIGGGLIEDGHVVRGRATAGQLGHIPVDPAGPPCLCGRIGCVEAMSSGTALGRLIRDAGLPPGTTAADLLDGRVDGAETVLAAWATPLRRAVDALTVSLDCERVILGGGLGCEAAEAVSRLPELSRWYRSEVVAAALGDDAGVIGAGFAALDARPRGRRVVLVNGVPASGKSGVATALSGLTGWPVYALDTVKEPFLTEIAAAQGPVERPFNRVLGRASYKAIFALLAAAPAGTTAIVDAWFGFQPRELLAELLATAGIDEVMEIRCAAPPETVADRYRARAAVRLPGHPGAGYADELRVLAARAGPMRVGPVLEVDTTVPFDAAAAVAFVTGCRA
ncbi:MAG: ROK family protein [Amaricoccus sp.]|uniref:ROK family protein n=1 Tax=Amaricoccus sp. TaxID=1872485 RepID=UPI0039E2E6B2